MKRAVVCVATTPYYQRGQERLARALSDQCIRFHRETYDWPTHADKPYAFKAYALKDAADQGDGLLLWADACILPVASLEPLWERIERDGYWFSRSGWNNYEWTADSAYVDLFWEEVQAFGLQNRGAWTSLDSLRETNRKIEHVVATSFGLNVRHPKGKAFLDEYYRLASETRAFCGPWTNGDNLPGSHGRRYNCGPSDVRGHRHDQTAASVIAWRLGFELTNPPEIFAYGRADEVFDRDERTILLASGEYT